MWWFKRYDDATTTYDDDESIYEWWRWSYRRQQYDDVTINDDDVRRSHVLDKNLFAVSTGDVGNRQVSAVCRRSPGKAATNNYKVLHECRVVI